MASPDATKRELEVFEGRFQRVLSYYVGPDLSDEQSFAINTIVCISGLQEYDHGMSEAATPLRPHACARRQSILLEPLDAMEEDLSFSAGCVHPHE